MEVSGIWIRKEGDRVVLLFESSGTAPDAAIDITPEMIEAGSSELAGEMASEISPLERKEIAVAVYMAMAMRALVPKKLWYKAASEHVDGTFSHIVELNVTGNGPEAGKPRPLGEFETDA